MDQEIKNLTDLEKEITAVIEAGRKNAYDAIVREMETTFSDIARILNGNEGMSLLPRRPINGLSHKTLRDLASVHEKEFRISASEKDKLPLYMIEFMKMRSLTFEATRLKYPNYLKPWTKEEDEELERLWCEGLPVKSIAILFKRNTGAIKARIDKLELEMKYGER